jgi:hypothetical protein
MNKDILAKYEDIALTNHNIFNLLDGKFNLVLYPQLIEYRSIDEVLGEYGACVLLFEAKAKYGHWCCLWKLDNNTVSFFNSYGGFPDDTLDFIPEHFAQISNQNYPYLSLLMDRCPYELTYNEYEYQKHGKNIKTCGRWVTCRLWCREMDDDRFHKYIKHFTREHNITPDQFVTLLTM